MKITADEGVDRQIVDRLRREGGAMTGAANAYDKDLPLNLSTRSQITGRRLFALLEAIRTRLLADVK